MLRRKTNAKGVIMEELATQRLSSVFLFRSCDIGVSGFVTFVILVSGILDEEVSLSYVDRVGVYL